jgi:hypothetical protein
MATRQINRKKRPRKKAAGRFLYNSLDPDAQQRLLQWRKGSL